MHVTSNAHRDTQTQQQGNKIVLIDASWIAYRVLYGLPNLSYDGSDTSVIYGVFEQVLSLFKDERIKSNNMLFFFDSKKSHRKQAYPDYKRKRHENKTPKELAQVIVMKQQMNILFEALPIIGFPCYRQTGLESDDLIAAASQACKGKAVIVSADGDLWQCITDKISWYDAARGTYYDPKAFKSKKGIAPSKWGEVKCLAGCSTDNVSGVQGVGETTAIAFLTDTLPPSRKRYLDIVSNEGQRIIERNKGLVCLPHPRTRPIELRQPNFDPEKFFAFAEQYGLESYLTNNGRRLWKQFFSGFASYDLMHVRRRRRKAWTT